MSDCCLPNLGCLSIPVTRTDVQGPSGQNGISPTIIVGTVTTGDPGDPVVVTNVSTNPSIAEFDFTIPQGYTGTSGAPGVDGVTRLYTNFSPLTSTTISNWQSMNTYTLAANTLVNIGDSVILQFEVELLKKNLTIPVAGTTVTLPPYRRISIASGATSLTRYDTSSPLGEPFMTALSLGKTGTQTYLYRTTVELIKTAASPVAGNFISRVRWDSTIPSNPYTHNSISSFSINVANPIVFSLDIYQYQTLEIRTVSLTIDKITAA